MNIQLEGALARLDANYIGTHHSAIDDDLKDLDTRDFSTKKERLTELLSSSNTSTLDKIKISNFFCNKLSDMFRLSSDLQETIIQVLSDTVFSNLPPTIKLYYLRFRNEQVSYRTSCNVYENNIRDHLEFIPYVQILKYIVRSYLVTTENRDLVFRELNEMFEDENTNELWKMEIADIFLLSGDRHRGRQMLNVLRRRERLRDIDLEEIGRLEERALHSVGNITVYEDGQNVHNDNINVSVLKAAVNLIILEQQNEFNYREVLDELCRLYPGHTEIIEMVLERISIDGAKFSYEQDTFTLFILFSNLWSYIKRHKNTTELKLRLIEEMLSMNNYCSSGHLARFMNVIQGFTEEESLCIRISDKDQIKSVVTHYLNGILQSDKEGENALDSLMEGREKLFLNYVLRVINDKKEEWKRVYGECDLYILSAVKQYVNNKNIVLREGIQTTLGSSLEENRVILFPLPDRWSKLMTEIEEF